MTSKRIALVLGATGGIGGEVARRLAARGWDVRVLVRNPAKLSPDDRKIMAATAGDAMSAADVAAAATDASVIVHAVNPPGYRNWNKLVLPMLDNTIAAARSNGARIVLPGTVYNYGPDAFPNVTETSPQHPLTRKGKIRVEMERRLEQASKQGAKALIVRAGDFFGPRAGNNWFTQGLIKPGKPIISIAYPGRPGIGHQWAYLGDVAETMVQLLEHDDQLDDFAMFHMDGQWDADGRQLIDAISRVTGNPDLQAHPFPWWLVGLASPVVPLCRELWEMRYLWRTPVRLNNTRLKTLLGHEPHTPLDDAVRVTLASLNIPK